MTASRVLDRPAAAPQGRPWHGLKRDIHPGDFLVPAGFLCWVIGLSVTQVPSVQPYGLTSSLPVIFFAGVALLVVSAILELRHPAVSEWRLGLHAATLAVMLFATAPVVYPAARYSWLYPHVGIVQFVNQYGQVNEHVDIYQNYPGFFALAAWFDKVAGVGSPLAYAKWAQPVLELAAIPLLYLIYDSLALPVRQRWAAIFLFLACNWFGQDYFSPQGVATILSLGVMALALRWLYVPRPKRAQRTRARQRQRDGPWRAQRLAGDRLRWWSFPAGYDVRLSQLICAAIIAIFFVLSMSHQLSPYLLAAQLGALAVAGMLRPKWLPLALLGVALGYLLAHFSFVNSNYHVLSQLGSFFNNLKPPSLGKSPTSSPSVTIIARCTELLSVGLWGLGIAGAWIRRRSRQPTLALVILAFSPIVVLAFQGYGNEGILRVFLFALPYSAALTAIALVPPPAIVPARSKFHRARVRLHTRSRGSVRLAIALGAALILFFPAFFGNDSYNVMPGPEVNELTAFQQNLQPGEIFAAIADASFDDSANYPLQPVVSVFTSPQVRRLAKVRSTDPDIAVKLLEGALGFSVRSRPVYVVIAPSMIAYNRAYHVVPADSFDRLEQALTGKQSPWKQILNAEGVVIYELPANTLPLFIDTSPGLNGKHGRTGSI